ncbi:glycosyltransferase family 1 protein [bacterium]|nr:glycosyltransferase family 1 protein [bacterium]
MNISFSTPIVNLRSSNGYGYAGKNIVKSLNNLGYFTPFQSPKAPVQINFSQPIHYKLHKNQHQISYTPWESTIIPKEWKYYIDSCDEIWTTSDWCANVFEDNGYKVSNVYPHGIDPMWTAKKREYDGTIKFLHIGEPAPRKAGQTVVDAFIYLFGNKEGYSLTIKADQINTTRAFNNYIDKNIIGLPHQVYNNIFLITDVLSDDQLVNLYHNHDVLIYPTYGEGFGFIPLQALATGMPTISTYDWAHYKNYLGPLKIKSELIDSPWPFPHQGKVFEPNYQHLLETMRDVVSNFNAYSGYYYAQSTKIHNEYNWDKLTKKSFKNIFKTFY